LFLVSTIKSQKVKSQEFDSTVTICYAYNILNVVFFNDLFHKQANKHLKVCLYHNLMCRHTLHIPWCMHVVMTKCTCTYGDWHSLCTIPSLVVYVDVKCFHFVFYDLVANRPIRLLLSYGHTSVWVWMFSCPACPGPTKPKRLISNLLCTFSDCLL